MMKDRETDAITNRKKRAGWITLLFLLAFLLLGGSMPADVRAEDSYSTETDAESYSDTAEDVPETAEPAVTAVQKASGSFRFRVTGISGSDITAIRYAIWSDADGKDDMHCFDVAYTEGKTTIDLTKNLAYSYKVYGAYTVRAYAVKADGSKTFLAATGFQVKKPTVSVSAVASNTSGKFTVTASGLKSALGVKQVRIFVWQKEDKSDRVKYTAEKQTDGSYQVSSSIVKHGYHMGTYTVKVYVTDRNGIVSTAGSGSFACKASVGSVSVTETDSRAYDVIKIKQVMVPTGAQAVYAYAWSSTGGKDDMVRYTAQKKGTDSYRASVKIANHKTLGTYQVRIYALLADGSRKYLTKTTFTVEKLPYGMIYYTSSDAGTIKANVFLKQASSGISEVLFPAWHTSGQSDLNWYSAKLLSNGAYSCTISTAYHAGHHGTFRISCYWRDTGGTLHGVTSDSFILKKAPTGTLQSCKITGNSHNKVTVKASTSSSKKRTYGLFKIAASASKISVKAKPIKTVTAASSVSITTALGKDTADSLVDEKLVIGVKVGDAYLKIGSPSYITNPYACAEYTYAYPTPSSKKGLQVNTDMLSDAAKLGVKNAVINIPLNSLISNGATSVSYQYNGTTYYYEPGFVEYLDRTTSKLASSGAITTGVILMQYDSSLKNLIIPSGRSDTSHAFYGLNTQSESARKQLAAAFTFLADRYSDGSHKLVNWVMGNEVADYDQYYWCGNVSESTYIKYYTDAYRTLYNSVRSVYKNARVYISLDQCWNYQRSGTYTGKSVLTRFVKKLKKEGAVNWNIAFHPYPLPLTNANFWSGNALVTNSANSPVITMKNLSYLTNYIKKTYGSNVRFILSETGFTSTSGESVQAAAIAYAYYLADANDMVDALVIHRHVDHRAEMAQGLYLGLWYNNTAMDEYASSKKLAYTVFRYMDTSKSLKYTNFALSVIGASSWKNIVPGFKASKYS